MPQEELTVQGVEITVQGIDIPSDRKDELISTYREDTAARGTYAGEMEGAAIADFLNRKIEIYEFNAAETDTNRLLADGEEETLDREKVFISYPILGPDTAPSDRIIRLLYIPSSQHYEALKDEASSYKRVGVTGDGDCLYRSVIRATEGDPGVQIPEINDTGGLSNTEDPLIAKIMRLRKEAKDRMPDEGIITFLQASDRRDVLGSRVQRLLSDISSKNIDYNTLQKAINSLKKEEAIDYNTLQRAINSLKKEEAIERKIPNVERLKTQIYLTKLGSGNFKVLSIEEQKVRDKKLSEEERIDLYKAIQLHRKQYIRKPKHIIDLPPEATDAERLAYQEVTQDVDYRALHLAAILDSEEERNQKFRVAMRYLSASSEQSNHLLKKRYKLITGEALKAKLESEFQGEQTQRLANLPAQLTRGLLENNPGNLQLPVLKELLGTGRISPAIEMAAELKLLHIGIQPDNLNEESKANIRRIVKDSSGDFVQLAEDIEPEDPFLKSIHRKLKRHPGFRGELISQVQITIPPQRPEEDIQIIDSNAITGDYDADYLLSLIYNFEGQTFRTSSEKKEIHAAILAWAESASPESRRKLINARSYLYEKKVANHELKPFIRFWAKLAQWPRAKWSHNQVGYAYPDEARHDEKNWMQYIGDSVAAKNFHPSLQRIHELEAFLNYQKTKLNLTEKLQRKETRKKIMNLLSSEDNWDALRNLEIYARDQSPMGYKIDSEEKALLWLEGHLEKVGLNEEDRVRVKRQLQLRGAHAGVEGDPLTRPVDPSRNMDQYQSLKKKLKQSHVDPVSLMKIVMDIKPGSFDQTLISQDEELLNHIQTNLLLDNSARLFSGEEKEKAERIWKIMFNIIQPPSSWEELNIAKLAFRRTLEGPKAYLAKSKDQQTEKQKVLYWAARLTADYELNTRAITFYNKRSALKVAFQSSLSNVSGAQLRAALDPTIVSWIEADEGTFTLPRERQAHQILKDYLNGTKTKIEPNDMLAVSDGLFANDQDMIDFSLEVLSPEDALKLWFRDSFNQLKQKAQERLNKYWELKSADLANPRNENRITTLGAELQQKNQELYDFPLTIDGPLEEKLSRLAGNRVGALKEKLLEKAGQALIDRTDPEVQNLNINPAEASLKGRQLKGISSVLNIRQLERGIGWHRLSPRGTISEIDMGGFLSVISENRDFLKLNPQAHDFDKKIAEQLDHRYEKLATSLKSWRVAQDTYRDRTVTAMTSLISFMVFTAGLASGVAAAPATVQLIWALSTTGIQSTIKNALNKTLSRKGEISMGSVVKEVFSDTLQATSGFFVTNELTTALNVGAIRALDINTPTKKLFTNPMLKTGTDALQKGVAELTTAFSELPFILVSASHTEAKLAPHHWKESLINKLKNIPLNVTKSYAQGLGTGVMNLLYNVTVAGTYDATSDFSKLYPAQEQKEDAIKRFMDWSSLANPSQFFGGPTDNMGASVWAGSDDASQNSWWHRLVNSLKTSLHEECFRETLMDELKKFAKKAFLPTEFESDDSVATTTTMDEEKQRTGILRTISRELQGMGVTLNEPVDTVDEFIENVINKIPADQAEQARTALQGMKTNLEQEAPTAIQEQKTKAENAFRAIQNDLDAIEKSKKKKPPMKTLHKKWSTRDKTIHRVNVARASANSQKLRQAYQRRDKWKRLMQDISKKRSRSGTPR